MKRIAAASAVTMALLSQCAGPDTDEPTALPAEPAATSVTAAPPASVLPAGLVARVSSQDGAHLRVYDPDTGALRRSIAAPAGEAVRFSPDWSLAADIDQQRNAVQVYSLSGDRYVAADVWNTTSLRALGLTVKGIGFVTRTGRLVVDLEDELITKAVSVDPRRPTEPPRAFPGISGRWDSYGEAATVEQVIMTGHPEFGRVRVVRSSRELVDATVIARDTDGDGRSAVLYTCAGRQHRAFTLVCHGNRSGGVLAELTADPAEGAASLRIIYADRKKPFEQVLVAPDGKRLLAQRPDGFYATTLAGGKPRQVFRALPVKAGEEIDILGWI